jgi:hypothetical protein
MKCKVRNSDRWAAYCAIPQADEGQDSTRQGIEGRREEGSEEDQRRLEGGARVSASARSRSLWRWTERHPALGSDEDRQDRMDSKKWILDEEGGPAMTQFRHILARHGGARSTSRSSEELDNPLPTGQVK